MIISKLFNSLMTVFNYLLMYLRFALCSSSLMMNILCIKLKALNFISRKWYLILFGLMTCPCIVLRLLQIISIQIKAPLKSAVRLYVWRLTRSTSNVYFFISIPNRHIWSTVKSQLSRSCWDYFYKFELPGVQINLHFG